MADDPAAAVTASGRERMDRALEAIERVATVAFENSKRLVVVVSAHVAFRHDSPPFTSIAGT
jgi:hypothetical protein